MAPTYRSTANRSPPEPTPPAKAVRRGEGGAGVGRGPGRGSIGGMTTYLAFLRAINLGRTRKFGAADLRACLESGGYGDVESYINTGNVRFNRRKVGRTRLEAELEDLFLADRGFDVPTIVFTPDEFAAVASDTAELAAEHQPGRHYVSVLRDEPDADLAAAAEATAPDLITLVVRGRALHFLVDEAHREGGVDITKAERILGTMTNRNARVVRTIAERWCTP